MFQSSLYDTNNHNYHIIFVGQGWEKDKTHFPQYFLYKVDVQSGGAWARTVSSKNMNLISTQVYKNYADSANIINCMQCDWLKQDFLKYCMEA